MGTVPVALVVFRPKGTVERPHTFLGKCSVEDTKHENKELPRSGRALQVVDIVPKHNFRPVVFPKSAKLCSVSGSAINS